MNSIDKNQREKNYEDLRGARAVAKIQELVEKSPNCFFCTAQSESSRPMNIRQVDDSGNLWFLSANDSFKNEQIAHDPVVKIYLQGSQHAGFLELTGRASIETNRKKLEELWEPILKTWFTDGINDPRISIIRFTPTDGHYWDTKHGMMVASIKMVIGAFTGTTFDDGVQGSVRI